MPKASKRFKIGDYEFVIRFAEYPTRTDHKTRIYIDGADAITEMEQPPISTKGVDAENDRLWRAFNKLELAKMREVLDAGMDLIDFQIHTMPEKIKFSRKAGCSCGCSPGFVSDRPLLFNVDYAQVDSIWISKIKPADRTFTMADFDSKEN